MTDNKTERIIVLYKPHNTIVSIMRKQFDPAVHGKIELSADTEPVTAETEAQVITIPKTETNASDGDSVDPASNVEPEVTLDFLLDEYEAKFGKRPQGKWAKDKEWLIKKLDG